MIAFKVKDLGTGIKTVHFAINRISKDRNIGMQFIPGLLPSIGIIFMTYAGIN